MNLEQSKVWTIDEGACGWNVATGDVDDDGVMEIVTVGCTYSLIYVTRICAFGLYQPQM